MSEFKHLVEKAKIVIDKLEKELACYQVLPTARALHDELEKLFGENEAVVEPAPVVAAEPESEIVAYFAPAAEETVAEVPAKTKRSTAAKSE